jgi:hypothetical protein
MYLLVPHGIIQKTPFLYKETVDILEEQLLRRDVKKERNDQIMVVASRP